MMRIAGLVLLASAFSPLVALLALLRAQSLGWVVWPVLAECVFSLIFLAAAISGLRRVQTRPLATTAVRAADERILGFTSSYILPIVVALLGDAGLFDAVATCALVGFIAWIYVQAGLYHLNPTLAALGFRLYEVTLESGEQAMVLSPARHIPQRGQLQVRYLGDHVALQLKGRA
jgi:hypothetical protein